MMQSENEQMAVDLEGGEAISGTRVLLLVFAWVTIALGGYYIAVRMIV